jgi:Na+/proline symporter
MIILKRIIQFRVNISIADFISLRYGNSRFLGALVTLICIFGIVPYIALQLKSISDTFHIVTKQRRIQTYSTILPLTFVSLWHCSLPITGRVM